MTNDEAIQEIQRWLNGCPYEETREAFNLEERMKKVRNENN